MDINKGTTIGKTKLGNWGKTTYGEGELSITTK